MCNARSTLNHRALYNKIWKNVFVISPACLIFWCWARLLKGNSVLSEITVDGFSLWIVYCYRVSSFSRFFPGASCRDFYSIITDDQWLIFFPDMGNFVPKWNFDQKSIQNPTKWLSSQMSKSRIFQNSHEFTILNSQNSG